MLNNYIFGLANNPIPNLNPVAAAPNFNNFGGTSDRGALNRPPIADVEISSINEDVEEVTIEYIINEKPKTKVVREFFEHNLASIKSEEDLLFEQK